MDPSFVLMTGGAGGGRKVVTLRVSGASELGATGWPETDTATAPEGDGVLTIGPPAPGVGAGLLITTPLAGAEWHSLE